MAEGVDQENNILKRADQILQNLNLSWQYLEGKDILDVVQVNQLLPMRLRCGNLLHEFTP